MKGTSGAKPDGGTRLPASGAQEPLALQVQPLTGPNELAESSTVQARSAGDLVFVQRSKSTANGSALSEPDCDSNTSTAPGEVWATTFASFAVFFTRLRVAASASGMLSAPAS